VATLNSDIGKVSAILKRNPAFLRIPGVRLMVTSYIGYPNAGFGHAVRISAGLYPPNTWQPQCTLTRGPEFFNKGHVHVTFTGPNEIFYGVSPRLRDDTLTAYAEPTGAVQVGAETYFESIRGVVLAPGRAPAWVPVTTAEWLSFREREAAASVERLTKELTEQRSAVERYRADMEREIAQARDEATRTQLRKAMEENSAMLRQSAAAGIADLERRHQEAVGALQRVRDERTRLSPAQLDAQALVNRTPLVKVNPALAGGSRRVNLIVVHAVANDRAMDAPLKQAVREMDFSALRTLLE
jgi:hypothetical protein